MIDLTTYRRNMLGYKVVGNVVEVEVQYNTYPDNIKSRYRIFSSGEISTYLGSELLRYVNVYDDQSVLLSREQIEDNRKVCQRLLDMRNEV